MYDNITGSWIKTIYEATSYEATLNSDYIYVKSNNGDATGLWITESSFIAKNKIDLTSYTTLYIKG